MSLEARLEAATTEYQKLQKDITNAVENLQKLDSQLQENEIVQKEFSLLKDDSNIYKLVGPVLVKQDKAEATENVARRLEHIQSDMFVFFSFFNFFLFIVVIWICIVPL
ncbi:prefoldin subunit 6 [Gigaspora margarita]|uniref:Prefoldin subunit 6 n=1 Tax=Gigaspora margarita TaxID=4874 RepID=A0A8H4AS47_GIGMA|nr:prefoldin subunit 6 [Gigaspora margarita]